MGAAIASPSISAQRRRQHVPRMRGALGQQFDAGHVLGRKAQPQQLQQVAAGAAADLERALVGTGVQPARANSASIARWRSCTDCQTSGRSKL